MICNCSRTRVLSSIKMFRWTSHIDCWFDMWSSTLLKFCCDNWYDVRSLCNCNSSVCIFTCNMFSCSNNSAICCASAWATSSLAVSTAVRILSSASSCNWSIFSSSFRMVMSWFFNDRNSTSYSVTSFRKLINSSRSSFDNLPLLLLAWVNSWFFSLYSALNFSACCHSRFSDSIVDSNCNICWFCESTTSLQCRNRMVGSGTSTNLA